MILSRPASKGLSFESQNTHTHHHHKHMTHICTHTHRVFLLGSLFPVFLSPGGLGEFRSAWLSFFSGHIDWFRHVGIWPESLLQWILKLQKDCPFCAVLKSKSYSNCHCCKVDSRQINQETGQILKDTLPLVLSLMVYVIFSYPCLSRPPFCFFLEAGGATVGAVQVSLMVLCSEIPLDGVQGLYAVPGIKLG